MADGPESDDKLGSGWLADVDKSLSIFVNVFSSCSLWETVPLLDRV